MITAYGYTHNCRLVGIPFEECIRSMLEVCDEVVILDAGSTDGTYEILQTIEGLHLHRIDYDYDAGTADSDLKRLAREHVKTELCWGIDVDEVLHEKDQDAWRALFSEIQGYDLLVLPRADFWTLDLYQIRHRYHAIHRNLPYLTVGIPLASKRQHPVTKRATAVGMHYDYIDLRTGEAFRGRTKFIPNESMLTLHEKPIWNRPEVAQLFEDYIQNNPVIYHYCWANIFRKRLQQCVFDGHQNALLFGELSSWQDRPDLPSFEDIRDSVPAVLDFGRPYLVEVPKSLKHPAIMKSWLDKYSSQEEDNWRTWYQEVKHFVTQNST